MAGSRCAGSYEPRPGAGPGLQAPPPGRGCAVEVKLTALLASKGGANLSTPVLLRLPRRIYEEMVAQAVEEVPNECCGLLAGRPGEPVARRYPLVNAAASPVEYL